MVEAMKRPSSRRGPLLCTVLMTATILTLLGHVWAEALADTGPAHDTHHRGPAEVPASAHAVLCVGTLSGGAQSPCPTPFRLVAARFATAPPPIAGAAARPRRAGAVPSARGGDGSPPLFLLHATLLI